MSVHVYVYTYINSSQECSEFSLLDFEFSTPHVNNRSFGGLLPKNTIINAIECVLNVVYPSLGTNKCFRVDQSINRRLENSVRVIVFFFSRSIRIFFEFFVLDKNDVVFFFKVEFFVLTILY